MLSVWVLRACSYKTKAEAWVPGLEPSILSKGFFLFLFCSQPRIGNDPSNPLNPWYKNFPILWRTVLHPLQRGAVLFLVILNKVTKGWEILHPQNIVHVRTLPYLCVAYILYNVTVNKDT